MPKQRKSSETKTNSKNLYADALILAIQAHSGQYRKQEKTPFVIHPIRISEQILINFPEHENLEFLRSAALLHDVIEDTWADTAFLEAKFGKKMALVVNELTSTHHPLKEVRHAEKLKKMTSATDEAKIVRLFDMWDNLNDPFQGPRWKEFVNECMEVAGSMKLTSSKHNKKFEDLKKKFLKEASSKI